MRRFWLSSLPMIGLSALAIYEEYRQVGVSAYIFMAFCLLFTIYFSIPLLKRPLYGYLLLAITAVGIDLYHSEFSNGFVLLLCFYFVVDSIQRLEGLEYRVFLLVQLLGAVGLLSAQGKMSVEWGILLLLVGYPLIKLQDLVEAYKQKEDTYERVLNEYRTLKRQAHESERAARLEERTKIARDIHDSVGHKLTALLMKLQMLTMKNEKEEYKDLKALASDSLEETRHAVKALQTEENEGISSVLQLIRKLESESHIFLDFTLKKGVLSAHLSNQQNVALYRVLQESLTNAMKHAHSQEVKVVLALNAIGGLTFKVTNKLHSSEKWQWGFGLTNMKKRVEELGGKLNVYQREDEFVVDGYLPVEGEEDELQNLTR
ncbi:sensor histidine kinase [Salinibacillus xinjiangensis]|uniref:histidine kinase n=1 Tax=Salinibacillus xinjiangensis TaxID=1229268 RepID=A0A6G1X990_9BACI|nr:histidine kinase [Salinibacillus xinjiangensis]MRG87499.1 sensor histidine kinase [Salinibacillus xinjiangensis]